MGISCLREPWKGKVAEAPEPLFAAEPGAGEFRIMVADEVISVSSCGLIAGPVRLQFGNGGGATLPGRSGKYRQLTFLRL